MIENVWGLLLFAFPILFLFVSCDREGDRDGEEERDGDEVGDDKVDRLKDIYSCANRRCGWNSER